MHSGEKMVFVCIFTCTWRVPLIFRYSFSQAKCLTEGGSSRESSGGRIATISGITGFLIWTLFWCSWSRHLCMGKQGKNLSAHACMIHTHVGSAFRFPAFPTLFPGHTWIGGYMEMESWAWMASRTDISKFLNNIVCCYHAGSGHRGKIDWKKEQSSAQRNNAGRPMPGRQGTCEPRCCHSGSHKNTCVYCSHVQTRAHIYKKLLCMRSKRSTALGVPTWIVALQFPQHVCLFFLLVLEFSFSYIHCENKSRPTTVWLSILLFTSLDFSCIHVYTCVYVCVCIYIYIYIYIYMPVCMYVCMLVHV